MDKKIDDVEHEIEEDKIELQAAKIKESKIKEHVDKVINSNRLSQRQLIKSEVNRESDIYNTQSRGLGTFNEQVGLESNRDQMQHDFLLDHEINQLEKELKIDNKIHKSELV